MSQLPGPMCNLFYSFSYLFYLIIIFGLLQPEGVNRVVEERWGRVPLHIAADFGQLEVMQYLIDNGADVNVRA